MTRDDYLVGALLGAAFCTSLYVFATTLTTV
jgi:hypothetical protein